MSDEATKPKRKKASKIKLAGERLAGFAATARKNNTSDWIDGLVDEINIWAESVGERDSVERRGDGIAIVRASQ